MLIKYFMKVKTIKALSVGEIQRCVSLFFIKYRTVIF